MKRIFQQKVLTLSSKTENQKYRRYSTYIKHQQAFCNEKQINPVLTPLLKTIEFITIIYKSSVGHSSLVTA